MTDAREIDPETGLPDGRRLLAALEAEPHAPRVLALVAARAADGLDEPFLVASQPEAGRRAGETIRAIGAEHRGRAFRVGGSSYALLLPPESPPGVAATAIANGLGGERGPFAAGVIQASVNVPIEAPAGRAAVQLAFRRLRTRAAWDPLGPGRQVRDVLLQLLTERSAPGDQARRTRVAATAVVLGRRLGLRGVERAELVRAAELQDVGMIILQSGRHSPLDAADWAVMRHHPVVGERVIGAAPALGEVAGIVRSCYERFDGSGYPDGLQGEQIPLRARIISVCLGFEAMTSCGPHGRPLSPMDTLLELSRCAGTQFDPRIVALLHEVVGMPEIRSATSRVA